MVRRRPTLNRPPRHKRNRYRAGSRVAQIIEILEEPTQLQDLADRLGLSILETERAVIYINDRVGYGIRDENGLISIYG